MNQKLHNPAPSATDSETLSQIREQAQLALMNTEISKQSVEHWSNQLNLTIAFGGIIIAIFAIAFPMLTSLWKVNEIRSHIKDAEKYIDDAKAFATEAQRHADEICQIKDKANNDYSEFQEVIKSIKPGETLSPQQAEVANRVSNDKELEIPTIMALRAKAILAQKDGKWDESVALWKSLLQFTGDHDGSIHFGLGYSYSQLPDYQKAAEYFEKVTSLSPKNAGAFNNWGLALKNMAKDITGTEADKLYALAFEKFQKATEIDPKDSMAFSNWGWALGDLAKTRTGTEADNIYALAFEKYQKATEIDPKDSMAFSNWGCDLGNLAKTQTGTEADKLYTLAFEKYQKAIEINPQYSMAFANWGCDLGNLAKTQTGTEADKLYTLAFEKYQKATEINPKNSMAFANWGYDLGNLAKTQTGTKADNLYALAFEKYQKATEINPQFSQAFGNWGTDLLQQAANRTGVEAEQLYKQASDLLQRGEALEAGSCAYNLACVKARLNDTEACRLWLETAKVYGTLPQKGKSHLETDSDLDSVRDLPWFKELLAELS